MAQKQTYLTREGLARLESELEYLQTVRRLEITDRLQRAKELSGTEENADYEQAKNEQAFVEGRIMDLEAIIKNASLIPQEHTRGIVTLGSRFTLEGEDGERETFTLVGTAEADAMMGRISNESPVGSAVMGRRPKEKVQVKTPSGTITYTIVSVE